MTEIAQAEKIAQGTSAPPGELERMGAELEIRNLIAKIFLLTDTSEDLGDYEQCFAQDVVWEMLGGDTARVMGKHLATRVEGRDAIMADRRNIRRNRFHGPHAANWHMTTNVAVSVLDRDTARAWTSWFFVEDGGEGYRIKSVGFYQDDIRRIGGRWRIAHRRFTLGKPPQGIVPGPAPEPAVIDPEDAEPTRLCAELAIRNLIARVFLLTDTSVDLSEYEQCFTEDAIWERQGRNAEVSPTNHLGSRAAGRAAIMADRRHIRSTKAHGPEASNWHMATNVAVSVTGKDTARAWTSWIYVADRGEGYGIGGVGLYQDDIRREGGRWRIAHRRYVFEKPPQAMVPRL